MRAQQDKLAKLYNLPEGTGVFLMPSGSDAEYIPLLIAKTLNPGKPVTTVVTCNEEVGSGTLDAARGKLFSAVEPIIGFTDGTKKAGDAVEGLADNIQYVTVNARHREGDVLLAEEKIMETLSICENEDSVPIVHTVLGSKTGIHEDFNTNISERVNKLGGVVVVDACQGRFLHSQLHKAIDNGACVLITGSKFYRAPPFCGAVFIAPPIMEQLMQDSSFAVPRGLNTFFGKSEVPTQLQAWKDSVHESVNEGLALRWQAGLAEMEPTLAIPEDEREIYLDQWRMNLEQ